MAFGDAVATLTGVLSTETEVVISGRLSNRDDRVSVFVDSIIPLAQWVAGIAKKITLDIREKSVLADVKKALATLGAGKTRVALNLYSAGKKTTMELRGGVELGKNTIKDFTGLGIKVEIE